MISEHLSLTLAIRIIASILIFGAIFIFPKYIKNNMEIFQRRRRLQVFLLRYMLWYISFVFIQPIINFIKSLFRQNKATPEELDEKEDEFILLGVGLIFLASFLSIVPDDFISGMGVELIGALISSWTFINYWDIRDFLRNADNNSQDIDKNEKADAS